MAQTSGPDSQREAVLFVVLIFLALSACGDPSPCGAGSFGPGDGDCIPCRAGVYCPAGSQAPVDCADDGAFDDDSDPTTACVALTECAPNERELEAPSATSDRICTRGCRSGHHASDSATASGDPGCSVCPAGTFNSTGEGPSCTPWRTCEPGEYIREGGSAFQDRMCEPCAPGTSSDRPNVAVCQRNVCPAGTLQTALGSSTSLPSCEPCSAGSHCAGGGAPVVSCDDGDDSWDHDGNPATACVARTLCFAGTYVSNEGDALHDRACGACPSGSYSATPNATACNAWTDCPAGQFVQQAGSSVLDQQCSDCPAQAYTDGANQAYCLPHDACPAGTLQTLAGSSTSPPSCASCDAGSHCAGGEAPSAACNDGEATWDHDADPATACVARTVCQPGQIMLSEGDALHDRSCQACAAGTYSTTNNALACTDFTICDAGEYVSLPGTATRDQVCSACAEGSFTITQNASACSPFTPCHAGAVEQTPGSSTADRDCGPGFNHQFGTSGSDYANSVSVDAEDNIVVAGGADGSLPGQTVVGRSDPYVRKYDGAGNLLWTRQFGSSGFDTGASVSVDASQNILVAGSVEESLPGQTSQGSRDAFVRKYDRDGRLLWTRQFGSISDDYAFSVSVDADENVLIAGQTMRELPGQGWAGSIDAFVRKYDADGNVRWTRQFGTEYGDHAQSVSADADGNVLVAGDTYGSLPGHSSAGGADAFLRKYDRDGSLLWTRQFGGASLDQAWAVRADTDGNIYVAGDTYGGLEGQDSAGGADAFLRKYDRDGNLLWTRQFGTAYGDSIQALVVDADQNVLTAGGTAGTLPDQSSLESSDAFVRKYDRDGNALWTRQFGSYGGDSAPGVGVDANHHVVVAGSTSGSLPGQNAYGQGDAYVTKFAPP